ncbi:MAG TPA: signal recognition particle-docking protein FtsY, partial [Ruminococcaceae bacterium]|nr:signal recognition particle-docking protein FtsY [Oscillospiraceae bacterium]
MGFFAKIKAGLQKTKDSFVKQVECVFNSFTKIDEELFEELEELLITADVGVTTTEKICARLREEIKKKGITDPSQIKGLLKEIVAEMMDGDCALKIGTKPSVIMVIGVNGVGKTTTIGKMAHYLTQNGKKVLLGAADTFRAAA